MGSDGYAYPIYDIFGIVDPNMKKRDVTVQLIKSELNGAKIEQSVLERDRVEDAWRMDRLSKRRFVIVCHEKVVRIPLEGDEMLRVHGERTQGVVKTLMNTKFRIDLVLGATPVAKSPYHLAPSEMQELSEQLQELQDKGSEELGSTYDTIRDMIILRIGRKERVKPRRVRAMAMTIQYGVRGMILAAQSEAFKQENVPLVGSEMDEAHASSLRYLSENEIESSWILSLNFQSQSTDGQSERMSQTLEDIMRACVIDFGSSYHLSIRCAPFEALYGRKCRSPVLWVEIGESSLTGLELVQETTDKVTSWKRVVCFEKKGKLALRYVGPFEILERIGLVADSLHVPLDEIKVDKTLCFIEEPVEIMDYEVKSLKRSRISLVKVRWNSKRGPEFTWEREGYMKSKYPQLFVDRADESAS
ncbi:putative reverse transcriptase domain-containing protein [Tanacetum coccineum]